MHLKRRLTSLAMAVLLTLSCAPTGHAYTDLETTWAAGVIQRVSELGLMEGYPDGRFGVGDYMTRAQFVTVLCRLFGWEAVPGSEGSSLFDVSGHWAEPCIQAAALHGAIDSDGAFRPDDYISRLEMAQMLVRALGYGQLARSLEQADLPFSDVTEDRGCVAIAYQLGIINGVEEKGRLKFLPTFSAPREQAAAMLVRCHERYRSSTSWLHGFYAFSSYPQISYAGDMDCVSVGWAQLQFIDGQVLVNSTSAYGNDWSIPQDPAAATGFFDREGVPYNLNVFATAPAFTSALSAGQQEEMLTQLVRAAQPYAGLTIDFEGFRTEQREDFTAFMAALRARLPQGVPLYVCVQPDTWYGGYDYRALGDICDKVILMAHDYQWTEVPDYYIGTANTSSPVTPLPQIYTALQHITDPDTGVQDKSKLALQISFGTAGFRVDENGLLLDRTIYHPAAETIARRMGQADTVIAWDETSCNPWLEYTGDDGEHYKLWFEDTRSVQAKLQLARMFGVTGVSVWRLGNIPDYSGLMYYDVMSLLARR